MSINDEDGWSTPRAGPNRTSSFHFLFQTLASSLMPAMTGDWDRMTTPPSCAKTEFTQNRRRNHARGREMAASPSQVKTPARHLLQPMNGILHFLRRELPVMTEVGHDGDVSPANLLDVAQQLN